MSRILPAGLKKNSHLTTWGWEKCSWYKYSLQTILVRCRISRSLGVPVIKRARTWERREREKKRKGERNIPMDQQRRFKVSWLYSHQYSQTCWKTSETAQGKKETWAVTHLLAPWHSLERAWREWSARRPGVGLGCSTAWRQLRWVWRKMEGEHMIAEASMRLFRAR